MMLRSLFYFFLLCSGTALANECDCTQITGSCSGYIDVTPTKSPAGLYGADLTFHANVSQCAKIEYWVDGTPALTVLANGKYAQDSVVGTEKKPFTANRITYKSCMVCKTEEQKRQEEAQKAASEAETQAAVDNLVQAATNDGSLEPSTYSASGNSSSHDDFTSTLLQAQAQLQQAKLPQPSQGSSAICNDNSDACYCARHGGVRCFGKPTIVNPPPRP